MNVALLVLDWKTPALVEFGPTQECGCPFERWQYLGVELLMHYETTGAIDVDADGGDWDTSFTVWSRGEAFKWVDNLPFDD